MSSTRSILAFAIAALLAHSPAQAQYALGDGRLLDRNMQQGSGGVNAPTSAPQSAYGQYGNAIVTGNVGGLNYFHGNVGYRAPGEFSGTTPDTVSGQNSYLFRQQALSPYGVSPTARQPQFSNPLVNPSSGGNIIYRSGSGVTSGDVSGQQAYSSQYYTPSSSIRRDEVTSGMLSNPYIGATETTLDASNARFTQQRLGYMTRPDGSLYQVSASPLTGVRENPLDINRLITEPSEMTNQAPSPGATPNVPAGEKPGQNAPGSTDQKPGGANQPTAPDTDRNGEAKKDPNDRRIDDRLAGQPLGERLGERIDALTSTNAAQRGSMFRTDALDAAIFNKPGVQTAQPGEDVYYDLLRKINARQPAAQPATQAAAAAQARRDQLTGGKPATSEVDRIAAQLQRIQAGQDPAEAKAEVDKLLNKLDYKLPPLQTLAGSTGTGFNRLMANGESQLQNGQYFKAEEAYTRALALRPDYPLAQIGRVHAEIGSGVYFSAGSQLRDVLAKHPELIASRYGESLLPPSKTLNKAGEDLDALMKLNRRPESALVAAYLAYQQNQPDVLRRALDEYTKRNPNDPLLPVLRRVWEGNIDITKRKVDLKGPEGSAGPFTTPEGQPTGRSKAPLPGSPLPQPPSDPNLPPGSTPPDSGSPRNP
jgi:tetratricopeptide (TPR) repeat protein